MALFMKYLWAYDRIAISYLHVVNEIIKLIPANEQK